jgi:hypothetical protein
MIILGAGLAGLLAGSIFQDADIYEAGPEEQTQHKAVLRFRSSAVGDALGIEFKPVTVNKQIIFAGVPQEPSIRLANLYSMKVVGRLVDRSIWNLAPAQRFIAPEDLVQQMARRCRGRVVWNTPVDSLLDDHKKDPIVSTIPMMSMFNILYGKDRQIFCEGEFPNAAPCFRSAGIVVRRWRIPNASIYQTIYFPSPATSLYRASITGDLLIAEFMQEEDVEIQPELFRSFGIEMHDVIQLDKTDQRYGKIETLEGKADQWRRQFILQATLQHNVYSLGRFATWRNILMDDVLKDVTVIKRLISGGAYAATRKV